MSIPIYQLGKQRSFGGEPGWAKVTGQVGQPADRSRPSDSRTWGGGGGALPAPPAALPRKPIHNEAVTVNEAHLHGISRRTGLCTQKGCPSRPCELPAAAQQRTVRSSVRQRKLHYFGGAKSKLTPPLPPGLAPPRAPGRLSPVLPSFQRLRMLSPSLHPHTAHPSSLCVPPSLRPSVLVLESSLTRHLLTPS